jgi:hypothetical protein
VLGAILGAKNNLHRLCMEACHCQRKGWPRGTYRGLLAPRGRPPPDHVPPPLPSRGGLWSEHGSLLGGALPWLSQVDGCLCYSFAQICVGKHLSMNFSIYLCL